MMNAVRVLQLVALTLGAVALTVPDSRADKIRFPQAPVDAASAEASFDERAKIVTRYNACGRELDYSNYRREQLDENYEHQGEELTSILIAKIAWLTDPRFPDTCEHQLKVIRPKNPDGSFVHPTAEDFMTKTLGSWIDVNTPTRCSFPTSQVTVSDEDLRVQFHVGPGCLRQQVNEAIRAMVKDRRMGTDGLPCVSSLSTGSKGDWDVNVRELVRIFYMGTIPGLEVLDRSTIDHMYGKLLAAYGGLSDSSYSVVSNCDDPAGDELGSPEDRADRESWSRELLDAIGDIFEWLAKLFVTTAAGSIINTGSIGVVPFVLIADEVGLPHLHQATLVCLIE
jgi:hypothetical protein